MVRSVSLVNPGSWQRQHWIVRSIEVRFASVHFGSGAELVLPLGCSFVNRISAKTSWNARG